MSFYVAYRFCISILLSSYLYILATLPTIFEDSSGFGSIECIILQLRVFQKHVGK